MGEKTQGAFMKSYSSREIIRILLSNGWELDDITGSHHHFKHPIKKAKVTVAHPRKDIPLKTVKRIEKQAGLSLTKDN